MDFFHNVTTKDVRDPGYQPFDVDNAVTVPGDLTAGDWTNPWAGATLTEVSTFCLEAVALDTERGEPSLLLVHDDQGVEDEEIILCYNTDENEVEQYPLTNGDGVKKVRPPWHSALISGVTFILRMWIPKCSAMMRRLLLMIELLSEDDSTEDERNRRVEEIVRFERERMA